MKRTVLIKVKHGDVNRGIIQSRLILAGTSGFAFIAHLHRFAGAIADMGTRRCRAAALAADPRGELPRCEGFYIFY